MSAARLFDPPIGILSGLAHRSLIVGAAGAALSIVGLFVDRDQFFQSYLSGWILWVSIALGCLGILMIDHLAGGRWGLMMRRPMEAGASTLPFLALLMIPLLFGLQSLYSWARPEVVAADPLLVHKEPYLNVGGFALRAAVYFAVWSILALTLTRLSHRQDAESAASAEIAQRMRTLAAPGLGLLALAATFASIDWMMSLDPHWFSSLYGVYFLGGIGVSGFAFLILVATLLGDHPPLRGVLTRTQIHDYGKFLLAFVMLWSYFALSQLLIIWSANLPEEIGWYLERVQGGWEWMSIGIGLLHFGLPFLILLSADIKKNARRLSVVALLLLVMRWVDIYWQVAPTFEHHLTVHWLDLTTVVAVGGLWLWLFFRLLTRQPMLPPNAPRLEEIVDSE